MPEPLDYQLVLAVQTALEAITVAGGYHYTVPADAVKLDIDAGAEDFLREGGAWPVLAIEVQPDEEWDYGKADQLVAKLRLAIHWFGVSDLTDDASRMQTYFRACADIERALNADLTLGGLATDIRVLRREPAYDERGSRVWAEITVEIRHYRAYGAP